MIGITAYGAYIPRLRLSRKAAAQATGWLNPSLFAHGHDERAIANWDEGGIGGPPPGNITSITIFELLNH